jgi:hypothetical protein
LGCVCGGRFPKISPLVPVDKNKFPLVFILW